MGIYVPTKRYLIHYREWRYEPVKLIEAEGIIRYKTIVKNNTDSCDTIEEVNELTFLYLDMYKHINRPEYVKECFVSIDDYNKNKENCIRYNSIHKLWNKGIHDYYRMNEHYITNDTDTYFYGFMVMDFEKSEVIKIGGSKFPEYNKINPLKDLVLKDKIFREDNEIPVDYEWDNGEYEGWLQYRWGDHQNAIEIEDERNKKNKEKELIKKKKYQEEKMNSDIDNTETNNIEEDYTGYMYDDIQNKFDFVISDEIKQKLLNKYGW